MTPEQRIAQLEAELAEARQDVRRLSETLRVMVETQARERAAEAERRAVRSANQFDRLPKGVLLSVPMVRLKTPAERAEAETENARRLEENKRRATEERERRWAEREAKKKAARVYFIQQDGSEGLVKIGMTTRDVEVRLRELQAGHSCPLVVRAQAPGGRAQEGELHWRFASLRVSGEWFRPGPDLIAYIALVADRGAL